MIHHALELLRTELNAYIPTLAGHEVTLGNISSVDSGEASGELQLNDRVILSLVNIEEESAYKNLPNTIRTLNGGVQYANPPIFLNLYLLLTANFTTASGSTNPYYTALERISDVIRFFQGKRIFNLKNAPAFESGGEPLPPELAEMQLILDLYTMTFEQINHLWGSLGGKQIPFVMYKARLVRMQDRRTTGAGTPIEEIGTDSRVKN